MSTPIENGASVHLTREDGYRFRVRFGEAGPVILTDEPSPLGRGTGPNPAALLAAAVGNCLASSLLYCAGRARLDITGLEAEVRPTIVRNAAGRLRIGHMDVRLRPLVSAETWARMERCLGIFETFCIVTESVREGIPVAIAIDPVEPAPARQHAGPEARVH